MAIVDLSQEEISAGVPAFNNKYKSMATLNSVSKYTGVKEDELTGWVASRFFAKVSFMGDEAALQKRIQENYNR